MRQSTVQAIEASEVRRHFSSVLNGVFRDKTRVVVERSGVPVAGIISTDDLKRLDELDVEERRTDFDIIDELREVWKDVPDEEIEREAMRAITNTRAADAARGQ